MPASDLTKISGIGPSSAKLLELEGLNTIESVAAASVAELAAIHGFGPARASEVREAAIQIAGSSDKKDPKKDKKKRKSKKKKRKGKDKKKKDKGKKRRKKRKKKDKKKDRKR